MSKELVINLEVEKDAKGKLGKAILTFGNPETGQKRMVIFDELNHALSHVFQTLFEVEQAKLNEHLSFLMAEAKGNS